MQDPQSVDRLRRGDGSTLKRLFKANHARLYPLAVRLTRDNDAADEVIRAAFRKLWSVRKELDRFETIDGRLIRYVYEFATDYRTEHGITGIESVGRSEDADLVVAQLNGIEERERLVYLLRIVDGYSVRELSRAFEIDEEVVQQAIGSAMVMLNREFDRDQDSPEEPTPSTIWP